jgi:hypothetical protein
MPRLEFATKEEFIRWVRSRMDPTRYECYATTAKELILVPTVSTRPIVYAYFKAYTVDDYNAAKEAVEARAVSIYTVGSFEWRDDDRVKV